MNMLFPQARILRLDADTTGQKDAFDTKLESFRKGEADILLGTQMVTKGHDFGNVTLVGVVSADSGLYMDDYRAGEHTFSLITQVIGRAGRGKKPGRAVIQTYNPENPTLILAAKQDYSAFYENEIRLRRALGFSSFLRHGAVDRFGRGGKRTAKRFENAGRKTEGIAQNGRV